MKHDLDLALSDLLAKKAQEEAIEWQTRVFEVNHVVALEIQVEVDHWTE